MRSVRFWDFLLEWGGACLGRAQLDICKSNRRHRRKLQECTNSPAPPAAAAPPPYSDLPPITFTSFQLSLGRR